MPRYNEGRKFSGILYLHGICDSKAGGSLQRNMTMFKKLCGPDPLKNIVVVTTFWDEIELVQGIELETELKTNDRFFKGLVEGGSKFVRSGKFPPGEIPKGPEFQPPISIVSGLVALDPIFVGMQKELAEGKAVEETSAGAELYKELQILKLQQKRDLIDLSQKIAEMKAQNIKDRLAREALEDESKALKGQITQRQPGLPNNAQNIKELRREALEDESKAVKGQITQRQPGLLNNSHSNNINGGNFYNTAGDAHIYNVTKSSPKREFPSEVIIQMFTPYLTLELADLYKWVATSALHDSKERFPQPKCHVSTRKGILQRIFNWAEGDSAERILWLSGSPGAGKSAIAQTIAERCKQNAAECSEQKVRLAATFFFLGSSSERSTSARLVATLAYEISLFVPGAKETITKAIMDDPAIFEKDINSQLLHLITRPLALAARGWNLMQQLLIIIDGLDECTDEKEQLDVLSAISNALTTSGLPLRFFITSRLKSHIRTRFDRTDLQSATVHFVLDIDDTATQIATYLKTEFSRIRQERCIPETPWPPEDTFKSLAKKASGQFIIASAIIKFLDDRHFRPQERLNEVLGPLPHGMFSPFAEIDLLYTEILDAVPVSEVETTLLCLGVIILFHDDSETRSYGKSLGYLDDLFQLKPGGIEHLLADLHLLVDVQSEVSIRHTSFSDFLMDDARSGTYYLDEEITKAKIAGLFWATIPPRLKQFGFIETGICNLCVPNR